MANTDFAFEMMGKMAQRYGSPESVMVQCNGHMTVDEFVKETMNLTGKTYNHYAVRIGHSFVNLDQLVVDFFTQNYKVVYIHEYQKGFGHPSEEVFKQKIQDVPLTIYVRGGDNYGHLPQGFYPAFPKMTIQQFMTSVEENGNGVFGGRLENMWYLNDDDEVKFLNDESRKLVKNVLKDKTAVVYNRKMENTSEPYFSPTFSPSNWQPHKNHFTFGDFQFGHAHLHRFAEVEMPNDGIIETRSASDESSDDSGDGSDGFELPPNVLLSGDLEDESLEQLKLLKEAYIESARQPLRNLYVLEKELVRRGQDATPSVKVDDFVVMFPSGEPEDEPDEVEEKAVKTDEVEEKAVKTDEQVVVKSDEPRSSTDVPAPQAPQAVPQGVANNCVDFQFNGRVYQVSLDGLKTLSQFRERCGEVIGGIRGKDLRLFKEGDNEVLERGAVHLRSLGIVAGRSMKGTFRGRGGVKKAINKETRIATSKQKCDTMSSALTQASGSGFNVREFEPCYVNLMNNPAFLKSNISTMTEETIQVLMESFVGKEEEDGKKTGAMKMSEPNMLRMMKYFVPEFEKALKVKESASTLVDTLQNAFLHNLTVMYYSESKGRNDYTKLIDLLKERAMELKALRTVRASAPTTPAPLTPTVGGGAPPTSGGGDVAMG